MKHLLLALPILALFAGFAQANDHRALFQTTRASEQTDAVAAYRTMIALAEQGFAPAMDRVGYYHRHGVGTQKDLQKARHWYTRAVAAGHPWSTAMLARVEIDLGLGLAAHHRLEIAIRDGKPGVDRLYATAHIDGNFGRQSNPETGRAHLERLSDQGNLEAARDLLLRINWKRLDGPAPDGVFELVASEALTGEPRFAEPALIYLSRYGGRGSDVIALRAKLIEVPGIRERILAPERIRLAAIQSPGSFWTQVETILGESKGENFVHAASTAFWISKNAWVRVLQKELRALGYYDGEINALMTERTIRAQNRFCRDRDIWASCASGPLTGTTLRAVAEALQADRGIAEIHLPNDPEISVGFVRHDGCARRLGQRRWASPWFSITSDGAS